MAEAGHEDSDPYPAGALENSDDAKGGAGACAKGKTRVVKIPSQKISTGYGNQTRDEGAEGTGADGEPYWEILGKPFIE